MASRNELTKMGFTDRAIDLPSPKQSIEEVRRSADKLLMNALADSALREELKKDPGAVFARAGLPVGAVEDLERQVSIDGLSLSAGCTVTCISTCWWTDWF